MTQLSNLSKIPGMLKIEPFPGVYILVQNETINYIGESGQSSIHARIQAHIHRIPFNRVFGFKEIDKGLRKFKEGILIDYFKPPYNKEIIPPDSNVYYARAENVEDLILAVIDKDLFMRKVIRRWEKRGHERAERMGAKLAT